MPILSRDDRGPDERARADVRRRLGPYEAAYDIRRGYDAAPEAEVADDDRPILLFRAREKRRR